MEFQFDQQYKRRMHRYTFPQILLAALALGFQSASAAAPSNDYSAVLNFYAANKKFNGSVIVASAGKIDFLSATGQGSRQSGTMITTKSKFKIASVTKTFTAALILQLIQEGKIELKGTIGKYLPKYMGEAKDKVTIEHLLTYSSGIPNCEGNTGIGVYQRKSSVDEFIASYVSAKLEFVPGTKFSYDNGDYILLGRIIELVSGKTFQQNLQERILTPLGMKDTNMLASQDVVVGLVPTYNLDEKTGVFLVDDPMYIENYFAAGAMYSTAEDLLRFDQGVFGGTLLNAAVLKVMLTPRPELYNVAIGFWVSSVMYGAHPYKQANRQGSIWGANANWIHLIDVNKTIVILSNTNATDLQEFASQLVLVATGQKATTVAQPIAKEAVSKSALEGRWELDLRPNAKSEPYLKDFMVASTDGKAFSGEFYGTKFTNGRINGDWEKLYFAFSTRDKSNVYFHSGFVDGDTISGISYSAERQFTSHWTGVRKQITPLQK
jgi:CubicO group peptidase (beta-lactamase class C family)